MNAFAARRRSPEPSPPTPPPKRGFTAALTEHRAGIGAIVVLAVASGVGWLTWERYAEQVRTSRGNVLLPEMVEVVGIGPWITIDLKNEALRDASLDNGLPLDDPELARRLARAFDIHPWVREVRRVTLAHPAAAIVEVVCREPVAMIAVPGGLLPVDAEGMVLPSDDFSPEAAARYPKITGIKSGPRGAVGFTWGDPLVEEAAAVASVIGPEWGRLGLQECHPQAGADTGTIWTLVGDDDLVIRFGAAPGHELPGEPTAAMKVARLRGLVGSQRPKGVIDLTVPPPSESADLPAS
jgi:hypothetical protein